jgi:site-specific DNA-adenine methylase
MLQEGQTGKFSPPIAVTQSLFESLKTQSSGALRGYVGFLYSYRGRFLGVWDSITYEKSSRGLRHGRRYNMATDFKDLMRLCYNVTFYCCDYSQWYDIHDALIYCDPPYEGTKACGAEDFDTLAFWEQCRKWVAQNNIVFVSEYKAPKDFYPVWSMCRTDVDRKTSVQENLFVLKGSL